MAKKNPLPANSAVQKKKIRVRSGIRPIVAGKKPGRNDPCPCKSGKKFKKCCKVVPDFLGPPWGRRP